MNIYSRIILITIVTLLSARASEARAKMGWVQRIISGETLEVIIDQVPEQVRMIGIAPPLEEGWSGEEAEYLRRRIARRWVLLEADPQLPQRDAEGRRLVYIYLSPDGTFINRLMVCDGFARASAPESLTLGSELAWCERQARRERRAMWSYLSGGPTWEVRHDDVRHIGSLDPKKSAAASGRTTAAKKPAAEDGKPKLRKQPSQVKVNVVRMPPETKPKAAKPKE